MAELGYVGLGVMGGGVAKRLLDAGHTVTGWNRTKDKAQWLVDAGMRWGESPREVAEQSEIVFTMVTNTAAVRAVTDGADGILAGLAPGKVYVDMSTASPENSRALLTGFIKGAKKQLLIYDAQVSDNAIQKVLQERSKAGVEIRIIGGLEKPLSRVKVRRLADLRLHVRAIVRDGNSAFVGSQSLRKLELEGRREVGLIITHGHIARKIQAAFEHDWHRRSRKKVA